MLDKAFCNSLDIEYYNYFKSQLKGFILNDSTIDSSIKNLEFYEYIANILKFHYRLDDDQIYF